MSTQTQPNGTDRFGRSIADARPWTEARTLHELGELTARWLEGTSTYFPAYITPEPDPETRELVPYLTSFNRAGLWTQGSQPGLTRPAYAQRAFLDVICEEPLALAIDDLSMRSDLVVLMHRPSVEIPAPIAVTTYEGRIVTRSGYCPSAQELVDTWYPELNLDAVVRMLSAWWVSVIDPRWGRNDLLWTELRGVIEDGPLGRQ